MVIFLNDLGEAVLSSSPTTVGRNSNDASELVIVAPADSALRNAVVYTAFRLPNGVEVFGGLATDGAGNTVPAPAEELGVETVEEWGSFVAWRQRISSAVTSISGIVAFTIYCSTESMRTSATGTFEVTRAVRSFDPADSAAPDVWGQIATAIAQIQDDLLALGGEVEALTEELRADVGDWSDPEREENLRAAVEAAETDIAENAENIEAHGERIEANEEAIDELKANVGTRPMMAGYTDSDTLWGVIGVRPASFRRSTVWQTASILVDSYANLSDSFGALSGSVNSRLDSFGRELANLEAANKGLTFIERSERKFARSFAFPPSALPFATLNELGFVASTLSAQPLASGGLNYANGLTYSIDGNRITLNGTVGNDGAYFELFYVEEAWNTLTAQFIPESGSSSGGIKLTYSGDLNADISTSEAAEVSFTPTYVGGWIRLEIGGGVSFNNLVFQLLIGQPGEEIKPCAVREIRYPGTNLLPEYSNTTAPIGSANGLIISVQSDGGIRVQGTPTAQTNVRLTMINGEEKGFYLDAGTYCKTPNYSAGKGFVVRYLTTEGATTYWQTGVRTLSKRTKVFPYFQFLPSAGHIDEVFYPMIAAGEVIPEYSQPDQSWSFPIPQAVQNLPGYGLGISKTVCNEIRLETTEQGEVAAEYTERVALVELSGTEIGWNANTFDPNVNKFFLLRERLVIPPKNGGAILATRFNSANDGTGFTAIVDSNGFLCFFVPKSVAADLVAWKALLAEWNQSGKPLTVLYEREAESSADISEFFAEIGNNLRTKNSANPFTLVFENDNNLPAVFDLSFDETI